MENRDRDPILRFVAFSLLGFCGVTSLFAQPVTVPGIRSGREEHPLRADKGFSGMTGQLAFIENRGQFDSNVRFQAKSGAKVLWFTNAGLVFDVVRPVATSTEADPQSRRPHDPAPEMSQRGSGSQLAPPGSKSERLVFSEDFAGGSIAPTIEASAAQPGLYNYFIGGDPKNWRTGIVSYSQLLYRGVWPGIDIRFAVKGPDIEQEFLIHPGADPSHIHIGYRGVKALNVAENGSLVVETLFGPLRESAPVIFEEDPARLPQQAASS